MSAMVDRVARALRKSMFPNDNSFDDIQPHVQEEYRTLARAVIQAMREPTEAMISAWNLAVPDDPGRREVAVGHRAMIDEALK